MLSNAREEVSGVGKYGIQIATPSVSRAMTPSVSRAMTPRGSIIPGWLNTPRNSITPKGTNGLVKPDAKAVEGH